MLSGVVLPEQVEDEAMSEMESPGDRFEVLLAGEIVLIGGNLRNPHCVGISSLCFPAASNACR